MKMTLPLFERDDPDGCAEPGRHALLMTRRKRSVVAQGEPSTGDSSGAWAPVHNGLELLTDRRVIRLLSHDNKFNEFSDEVSDQLPDAFPGRIR